MGLSVCIKLLNKEIDHPRFLGAHTYFLINIYENNYYSYSKWNVRYAGTARKASFSLSCNRHPNFVDKCRKVQVKYRPQPFGRCLNVGFESAQMVWIVWIFLVSQQDLETAKTNTNFSQMRETAYRIILCVPVFFISLFSYIWIWNYFCF